MPSVQRFQKHQKVRQLTYQFSKPISYFANSVMSHLWTIAQHFRIRGGRKYERHRKYLKKKFLLLSESHDPEILSCTLTATYLHM